MTQVATLVGKEVRTLFTSPIAYAVIAVFIVLSGYTFTVSLIVAKQATLVVHGSDHGVSVFFFGLEPAVHHRWRTRTVVVQRGGPFDGLVQDCEDLRCPTAIAVDQLHAHVRDVSARPHFVSCSTSLGQAARRWRRPPAR